MAKLPAPVIGSSVRGHYGASGCGLALTETTIAAAWNVQGKPARSSFVDEARRQFAIALPSAANTTAKTDTLTALWLGPESWLLVAGEKPPKTEFNVMRDAINAAGGALFDVAASRVTYRVAGPSAAAVLATSCPLDLHSRVFAPGSCAQSVFGHIGALYYRRAHDVWLMMVAHSFARDAWHSLCDAAAQYGYDVESPRPFD